MGFFYHNESTSETVARLTNRTRKIVQREVRRMVVVAVVAVGLMTALHGYIIYA